jgi:post-segregation antitoxin (ccd killing protein)
MKKTDKWGGKRAGAGRKPQGKTAYNVTLTAKNVERAKRRETNFSALLDRLLAAWLG